jgi:hypothetical protein
MAKVSGRGLAAKLAWLAEKHKEAHEAAAQAVADAVNARPAPADPSAGPDGAI